MATITTQLSATIGELAIAGSVQITQEAEIGLEVTLETGKAGALSTRTRGRHGRGNRLERPQHHDR